MHALTTLIVDDHQLFRSTARLLLESEGHVVGGEAADGAAALSEAGGLHPDVVVLDVQLPDRTGFGVSHSLRAEGFAGRVVLVSSRSAAEYGDLVDYSGAVGWVGRRAGDFALTGTVFCGHCVALGGPNETYLETS